MPLEELLIKRRSIYNLDKNITQDNLSIEKILETALKYCPSAFNSQPERIALLLSDDHLKFWKLTADKLQHITNSKQFIKTKQKIVETVDTAKFEGKFYTVQRNGDGTIILTLIKQ